MMSHKESNLNVSIGISLNEIELSLLDTVAEISGNGKDEFSESSILEVRVEEVVEQEFTEEIVNSDQEESLSSAPVKDNEVEASKHVVEEPEFFRSPLDEDNKENDSALENPVVPSDVITSIEEEPANDKVHDEHAKAEIEDLELQEEVPSESIFMEKKALEKVSQEGEMDETKDSNRVDTDLIEMESDTESDITEENEPFSYKTSTEQATKPFVQEKGIENACVKESVVENSHKTRAKHNVGFLLKLGILLYCFSISFQ